MGFDGIKLLCGGKAGDIEQDGRDVEAVGGFDHHSAELGGLVGIVSGPGLLATCL